MPVQEASASRRIVQLIYALFFLSGFCGLVYEVLWMRWFAVLFGNTTYAATVVLSAFMGGLALGSRWFGRLVDRPGRRGSLLSWYGWMEIGVGAYCLAFESLMLLSDKLLLLFYHHFDPGPASSLAVKMFLSLGLLILPTALMGGTLPVLVKQCSRKIPEVGRVTGKLYFVNCFGAVWGTLLVAFWMIPHWGMGFSIAAAAAVNICVGVGALALRGWIAQPGPQAADTGSAAQEEDTLAKGEPLPVVRAALAGILLSGVCAMIYQVCWIRLLSMILGSSTYSFSLIVSAFITGIALGGLIISRFAMSIQRPALLFALCQVGIALCVLAMLPLYSFLPLFFIWCNQLINFTYETHEAFKFAVCFLVMCVPTTLFGMGFPLVSALAAGSLGKLAGRVGGVYALNTVGNIIGASAAGLVLIPLLGMRVSLEGAVALNLLAGFGILLGAAYRRTRVTGAGLAVTVGALALYVGFSPHWDRLLLSGGAFRYHSRADFSARQYLEKMQGREILYYREDVSATVTVEQNDSLRALRINGKVDASNGLDMGTQLLLGHLPMLLHPDPRQVLIIGMGSGVTCGAALAYPELKRLDCVEISPGVVEASRYFATENRRFWEDPRVRIILDDGRNYIFHTRDTWEVIASEPSNPWIAGIGSLYTEKFYTDCYSHLSRTGIICQWIHLYEMDESVLKIILRTFMKVFPEAVAFISVEGKDLLLIGGKEPLQPGYEDMSRRMRDPLVAGDLAFIGMKSLFTLLSTQVFDSRGMDRWVGIGQTNTDNFPLVEYSAPRGFFYNEQVVLPEDIRLHGSGTLLRKYLADHRVSADELVELAGYQMRTGMTNMVYSALSDALDLDPGHPLALRLMTRLLVERSKYHEAEVLLEKAAAVFQEEELLDLKFRVALALAQRRAASFIRKPDFSVPLALKQRLAGLQSSRSIHQWDIGEIYRELKDYRLAAAAYQRALDLRGREGQSSTPPPWFIMYRIGQCFMEQGELDPAASWFTRIAREAPEQPVGPAMLELIELEKSRARSP